MFSTGAFNSWEIELNCTKLFNSAALSHWVIEIEIKKAFLNDNNLIGKTITLDLTASDDIDQLHKGNYPRDLPEERRRIWHPLEHQSEREWRAIVDSSDVWAFSTRLQAVARQQA